MQVFVLADEKMTKSAQQLEFEAQRLRSTEVADWIQRSGRLMEIKATLRSTLVAGSIQLTFEHHASMVLLAKAGRYASTLALLRPLYEAYIWSTWTLRIATDAQLHLLAEDKLSRSLEKRIRDLDRAGHFDDPMLKTMKPVIDKMDGFVHGGFEHLQHRIKPSGVGPNYPADLMADTLKIADLFAVMALLEGPAIDGDIELGDRLFRESRAFLLPPDAGNKPSEA